MIYYLYNMCLWVLAPFVVFFYLPVFLSEERHRKNFLDRLKVPDVAPRTSDSEKRVWIHAVSVGETLAAVPLVMKLKEKRPDLKIFFSTITVTGMDVARGRLDGLVDKIFYLPFDFTFLVGKAVENISPDALVIMETEIWPNLIWTAKRLGVKVLIANGRISPRSFRSYRKARFFFSRLLEEVDCFLMQSADDAKRIEEMGAPEGRVSVVGNVKFDFVPPEIYPERVIEFIERKKTGRRVLVCASTHEGEEKPLIEFLERMKDRLFAVIAPRHPERFNRVAELLGESGLEWMRRSSIDGCAPEKDVDLFLLDSMGELSGIYRAADVVFVGGTLVPVGGHNVLEPAYFGKSIVVGPHVGNIRELVELLKKEGALFLANDRVELEEILTRLVEDESLLKRSGEAAASAVERFRGAVDRITEIIESYLGE